jgi:hypothetical protein
MHFLVDAVLYINDHIPGMAFRTRHLDGRPKGPLRALLVLVGAGSALTGLAIMQSALRGFDDGSLSLVLAALVGLGGVTLLAGGMTSTTRGFRNPAPPPLPENVIPLYRAQPARQRQALSSNGTRR